MLSIDIYKKTTKVAKIERKKREKGQKNEVDPLASVRAVSQPRTRERGS